MTHRENTEPNVKPGKKSWICGTKARFLQSHNAAWLAATAQGPDTAGVFYSQFTKLWIKKYGWGFDYLKDLEEDTPDPTLESLLEPEEPVSDAVAAEHEVYHNEMCLVSLFHGKNYGKTHQLSENMWLLLQGKQNCVDC